VSLPQDAAQAAAGTPETGGSAHIARGLALDWSG